VKLLAASPSSSLPWNESDLTEGIPVLLVGDINAKNTNWNSRLISARGFLLPVYANRNSCLIYGPNSATIVPYTHNGTPDVLGIAVVNDFVSLVYLTAPHSAQITCPSSSTPRAVRPFRTYLTAPASVE
jgi:hypothetical protein